MKVILATYGGDTYGIYTSKDPVKAMRKLWEEYYDPNEDSEIESRFTEHWAHVEAKCGEPIAEFRVFDVFDLDKE